MGQDAVFSLDCQGPWDALVDSRGPTSLASLQYTSSWWWSVKKPWHRDRVLPWSWFMIVRSDGSKDRVLPSAIISSSLFMRFATKRRLKNFSLLSKPPKLVSSPDLP
jgi:hypothetical protein